MSSRPRFAKFPTLKVPGSNMFKKAIGIMGIESKKKEPQSTRQYHQYGRDPLQRLQQQPQTVQTSTQKIRGAETSYENKLKELGYILLPTLCYNGTNNDNSWYRRMYVDQFSTIEKLGKTIDDEYEYKYGVKISTYPHKILFVSEDNCTDLANFRDESMVINSPLKHGKGHVVVITSGGCSIDKMISLVGSVGKNKSILDDKKEILEQHKRELDELQIQNNTTESGVSSSQNVTHEPLINGHSLQTTLIDADVGKGMSRNKEAQPARDKIKVPVFCNTRGKANLSYITLTESLKIENLTADVQGIFEKETGEEFEQAYREIVYVSADVVFEMSAPFDDYPVSPSTIWTQEDALIVVISANGQTIEDMIELELNEHDKKDLLLMKRAELEKFKREVDEPYNQTHNASKSKSKISPPHSSSGSGSTPQSSTDVQGNDNEPTFSRRDIPLDPPQTQPHKASYMESDFPNRDKNTIVSEGTTERKAISDYSTLDTALSSQLPAPKEGRLTANIDSDYNSDDSTSAEPKEKMLTVIWNDKVDSCLLKMLVCTTTSIEEIQHEVVSTIKEYKITDMDDLYHLNSEEYYNLTFISTEKDPIDLTIIKPSFTLEYEEIWQLNGFLLVTLKLGCTYDKMKFPNDNVSEEYRELLEMNKDKTHEVEDFSYVRICEDS